MRDYFAAKAMQGDWASQNDYTGSLDNDVSQKVLNRRASVYYRMADAMIEERNQ